MLLFRFILELREKSNLLTGEAAKTRIVASLCPDEIIYCKKGADRLTTYTGVIFLADISG